MSMSAARLLLFPFLFLCVACMLPEERRESLIALYNATGGPFWTNKANWNTSDPCATPTWFGVSCDAFNDSITGLSLLANNMTGSLPDLQLPSLITL